MMKIIRKGKTVKLSEIEELAAANVQRFQAAVREVLAWQPKQIEIDLSKADFVDCGGVGALVALRKSARQHHHTATVRLLNPARSARRLLTLTRMDTIFPIELTE